MAKNYYSEKMKKIVEAEEGRHSRRREVEDLPLPKKRNPLTRRAYGTIPVRKNFLPLIPVLGVLGVGATLFVGWKAAAAYERLTRPAVLVGAGAGAVVGFRVGRSLVEKLAYTAIGTGVGMLVDTYVLGNGE